MFLSNLICSSFAVLFAFICSSFAASVGSHLSLIYLIGGAENRIIGGSKDHPDLIFVRGSQQTFGAGFLLPQPSNQ